jgi:hypothetical protein
VRLYKPYYEAQCPSCDTPVEDREHVFHCPAADRELWRIEFLKKLAKKCTDLSTAPALQSVLVTGLECILYYTTVVVNEPPHLHDLCTEQDSIGWNQLFLGRFSKKWVELQTTFIHNSGLTPNYCNLGTPWLKQIIHFIWSECKKLWSLRNEAQHVKDEEAQLARRYEQCRRETEWLYGFKDECIAAHRTDIFHNTLQEHCCIERTERQLRTWIHCHKKAILASVETRRQAQQADRSRSLCGRPLRLNSPVQATRPT